jgi:hypothetical protein
MSKLQTFLAIMLFYILLSYVLFPLAFYYLMGKTLTNAGNGFVVGSGLSIILWYFYGRHLV